MSRGSFNPLDYPACLAWPSRLAPSAWMEHVPFAMAIIDMVRPEVFVELGTFRGVSYCGFCQAIAQLGLPTRAYAVDTWKGDPHNGFNGDETLEELRAFHDPLYSAFSRLVPATFDEALEKFPDHSIDLLHIDGYHTYEAVRHDFETWLPKMTERGVVLFHDINVREKDFGVWKFWEEVRQQYRSFGFAHQHGLGVLAVGSRCPAALEPLLQADSDAGTIREFFCHLGKQLTQRWQMGLLEASVAHERRRVAALEHHLQQTQSSLQQAQAALADASRAQAQGEDALGRLRARYDECYQLCQARHFRILEVEDLARTLQLQLAQKDDALRQVRALPEYYRGKIEELQRSLAWRCAHRLSATVRRVAPPGSLRSDVLHLGRRSLNVLGREGIRGFVRKVARKIRGPRPPQDSSPPTAQAA